MNEIKWFIRNCPTVSVVMLAAVNAVVWGIPLWRLCNCYNSPSERRRNMPPKTLRAEDLRQFTGSEQWYQHGLVRAVTYTDGAKYVADEGGAYWLLDEIALAQRFDTRVKSEPFQVWRLVVSGRQGVLTCDDGDDNIVYAKRIPFTDFPLPEIRFYFADNVILLPSEY